MNPYNYDLNKVYEFEFQQIKRIEDYKKLKQLIKDDDLFKIKNYVKEIMDLKK